jgi:hypothetical protein
MPTYLTTEDGAPLASEQAGADAYVKYEVWNLAASPPTRVTGDAAHHTLYTKPDNLAPVLLADAPEEYAPGRYVVRVPLAAIGDENELYGTSTTANATVLNKPYPRPPVAETGTGDAEVDHDTGGADNLRYTDSVNNGIDGATVIAYLASDYAAGAYVRRGKTVTRSDGRWAAPLNLNSGLAYTIRFEKDGVYGPDTKDVTVP